MHKPSTIPFAARIGALSVLVGLLPACSGLTRQDLRPLSAQPTQEQHASTESTTPPADGQPLAFRPALQLIEISTVDIAIGEGHHLAFPDVVRLDDGRLLVVYRQGDSHVDSAGRIVRQFGSPDGAEWTAPESILDTPDVDDRDPSVAFFGSGPSNGPGNGDLLLTFFRYASHTVDSERLILHHVFVATSRDGGVTFGPAVQVDPGPMAVSEVSGPDGTGWIDTAGARIRVMGVSSPVVVLDGRLVLPAYGGDAVRLSDLASAPRSRIVLWMSDDNGVSWRREPVNPDRLPETWLMEPALLRLSTGRVLLQIRTAQTDSPGGPGPLMQAVSDDGGRTFGEWLEPADLIGHAPDLIELSTGEVISAFRWVDDAYESAAVGLVVSNDQGDTWSEPIVVEDCGELECGYPSMVELDGGDLLVVYYADGGDTIRAKTLRIVR